MLQRLDYSDSENRNPRTDFDNTMLINDWKVPGIIEEKLAVEIPNAPDWWRGDEQASESFFKAMGIQQ